MVLQSFVGGLEVATKKQLIPFVSGLNKQQTDDWLKHLRNAMQQYEIALLDHSSLLRFKDVELAIVANPDSDSISALPKLEWVQSLWAGVEGLVSTLPGKIRICRMEDHELQKAMAEAVLTWVLYLHRHMHLYKEQQNSAIWMQHPVVAPEHRSVAVLGAGLLGQACCKRLQLNGFSVKAWSRAQKNIPGLDIYCGEEGFRRVLEGADIVVLLLPLTPDTQGLIDSDTIQLMKPGACLINFARGGIINIKALLAALASGKLEHAVLDVFGTEPLPTDDPLWKLSKVTVLPHISAPTNMQSASKIAAHNIRNWFERRQLPNTVDREAGY